MPAKARHVIKAAPVKKHLHLVQRPSGEIAAERILTLINEIGDDIGFKRGWQAVAARGLGITEDMVSSLKLGKITSVGTRVMDQICQKIGITIAELMDER